MGSGEWGVRTRRCDSLSPTPHSPFPTPYLIVDSRQLIQLLCRLNERSFTAILINLIPMQTRRKNASQLVEPVEEKSRNGKYEAILRAAARVFARSGYFNAKVSDVARTAGVADGTVYLYFKNKDDLLTSIFGWAMGEFINRARSEMADLKDPREKLRRFAHLHFSLLEQERHIAVLLQSELRPSTKFIEQYSTTYLCQ